MPHRLTLLDFMIEIEMTAVLDECRPRSTAISWNCARPRRGIFDGMNAERILVAQECIGDGRWLLNKASNTPRSGSSSTADRPEPRGAVSIGASLCRARSGRHDLPPCRSPVRRRPGCGADANMAKLLGSEAGWHAAEATMTTYGGFAFAREYDIERKWREIRLYQTAPISTNLILAYLGPHVLGMPRSY
jgi:acyl-CoA dehydrogenase